MPYMVTFTINIPPMLAYIPAPWILWDSSEISLNAILLAKRHVRVDSLPEFPIWGALTVGSTPEPLVSPLSLTRFGRLSGSGAVVLGNHELNVYVCINMCDCKYEYVCMYVCMSACLPACLSVCLPVCLSVCMHACMYNTCKCIHIHTHI